MLPIALCLLLLQGRGPQYPPREDKTEVILPSGKPQRQEILKADFAKSKAEAAELAELTQQLKEEIDKSEHQVLNLRIVKKAEEIERLARRIKDRLRRSF